MISSVKKQYCSFLRTEHGSKIYNDFKDILYSQYDSLVFKLCSDYLYRINILKENDINICDIGGGDGKRITQILSYLHSKYKNNFNLDFIEQSPIYCKIFEESNKSLINFSQTEIFNDYFENLKLTSKYDVIFLIHSIFAFDNGNSINKIISLLKPDGKIVVVSNSPSSFLAKLKLIVDSDYSDNRYEINDLENSLALLSYKYSKFSFVTDWIIPKQKIVKELEIIFDWISLGEYYNYSKLKKEELLNYALNECNLANDKYYFTEEEIVLIIPPV